MKSIKSIFVIAFALSLFTACKKEGPTGPEGPAGPNGTTTAINPEIYNKWEVISGMPGTKYIIVKSNNIVYMLDSATYGFKNVRSDMALITSTQISVFLVNYNYSFSHDTLLLNNLTQNIILKKNTNAPDETEWVTYVSIIDSVASPTGGDGREDIGFDGSNILWTSESSSSTLYKINPVTHVVTSLALSNSYYYGSTNYASTFLWISDGTEIVKVNPTTGAVISTSPTLCTGPITANALVGQDMWYCDWYGNVFTWNIISDVITPQFDLSVNGMEYTGGFLYIFRSHRIYKCQLSPFEAITTYYINSENVSGNCGGITYDGSHFWIVGYSYDIDEQILYKLSF